jgi:hypothetical protein
MFNPDDRYQSLDEVLGDLDELIYDSTNIGYKIKNRRETYVIGLILLLAGMASWKLTFMTELDINLPITIYVIMGIYIVRFIQKRLKKKTTLLSWLVFFTGVYMVLKTGVTWWKLLLLLFVAQMSAESVLIVILCVLVTYVTGLTQYVYISSIYNIQEYRWLTVALLSFAAFLMFHSFVINSDISGVIKFCYNWHVYIIIVMTLYISILLSGVMYRYMPVEESVTSGALKIFMNVYSMVDFIRVGEAGIVCCTIWIIREKILVWVEKLRSSNIFAENEQ